MLQCRDIHVSFGPVRALAGIDLEVPESTTVAVMGESGSGKTTLLRVVAGLVRPDPGTVAWRDRDITAQPPHLRHFGLMFQDYALFPHLTVGRNVAFGLRMRGVPNPKREAVVARMLTLVGLDGYTDRPVADLSGGEQQRVALARTLAPAPELVLLDEPLGALDRARRDQLLADMQHIFRDLGVTALYVTHDHHEAFAIADRVVVVDGGRRVAQGSPGELWADPTHVAAATLLGFPIVHGVAVRGGRAELGGAEVAVDLPDGVHDVAFRPGAVRLSGDGPIPVEVTARRFEEGELKAVIHLSGVEILALAPPGMAAGPARASIDPAELVAVTAG